MQATRPVGFRTITLTVSRLVADIGYRTLKYDSTVLTLAAFESDGHAVAALQAHPGCIFCHSGCMVALPCVLAGRLTGIKEDMR